MAGRPGLRPRRARGCRRGDRDGADELFADGDLDGLATTADLDAAVANLARHLSPGGVIVVDGWIRRDAWRDPSTMHVLANTRHGVAAARVARSRREGAHTTLELHHLVGTLDGIDYVIEEHHLTLFADNEYRAAFERAGMTVDVVESAHPDRDRDVGRSS